MTRERRKKTKEPETAKTKSKKEIKNNEDFQSEEEDDNDDFESVLADSQAHELLDNAISVLDDIIKQQERN